jgi:hypothetical protein
VALGLSFGIHPCGKIRFDLACASAGFGLPERRDLEAITSDPVT